jgi:reactive intermediate/imine deaminase
MGRLFLAFVITVSLSSFPKAETIALKNANIIDVETLTILKNKTVLLEGKTIKAIVDGKAKLDSTTISVDMSGKYIIPGLIDTHVHHATSPDDYDNDQVTTLRLRNLLRGGVTSVRDMGGDNRALFSLKRRAEIDVIQSPDIYYSVIIGGQEFFDDPRTVASAKGRKSGAVDWMRAVDANTNFDEVMVRAKGTGATGIKIYAKVPASVIPLLEKSANKHGLQVWSHAFVGPARPLELVKAGVNVISHAPDIAAHVIEYFYDLRRKGVQITQQQKEASLALKSYDSLMGEMKAQGTILDATLTVFEQSIEQRGEFAELMYKWGLTFTRLAHQYGVKISTGTDGTSDALGMEYPLVHHEMQLLVNNVGLSPLEALRSATLIGAQVIGIDAEYGEVKSGKVANLVILNSDPSADVKNTLDIAHVIKNGKFAFRGNNPALPFSSARKAGGMLWLSGQLGNLPTTKVLASQTIEGQMKQTMDNIGLVLQEYDLNYEDIAKCTLMLADISDWPIANQVYTPYFTQLPARSAFATSGLALGAKVEIECVAEL